MTLNPQEPIQSDTSDHYFTVAELRACAKEFDSTTKFPDATLETKRQEAEEDFEVLAHRAFVPRTDVCRAWSHGRDQHLFLDFRDVRSVISISLTNASVTDLVVSPQGIIVDPIIGALRHPSVWPAGLYTVTYTHGKDSPPAAVKRAVMLLAKIYAIPSSIDPRATAVINSDIGGYRLSVSSGKTGSTGIPDVDAAARRYGDNTPAVG